MAGRSSGGTLSGPGFVRPFMGGKTPSPSELAGPAGWTGLVDAQGNPWSVKDDPLKPRDEAVAVAVVRDIPVSIVELDWAVADVRNALENHAIGLFQSSAMLSDAIVGDARVQAALGSRVGALFGLPQRFLPSPADTSGEVLAAWQGAFEQATEGPLTGNALVEVKRWAHLAGIGVAEIQWDTSVTPWQPYLKPWHLQHFYYDWPRRTLVAVTMDGPVDVTPGDGRWFVHAPHGILRGWMQGSVRALALPWLLRQLAFRDWARYSERHGMPLLKAKMPAMSRTEDKDRYVSSLSTLGTEAVVSLPQNMDGTGFDLELIEAASQSWEGFDRLIVRCDSAITLCLQWQNLTTEVKEGSFAAARVHADVKQSAVEFDEDTLARDIEWQIARPYASWNFGNAALAPRTRWDCEPLEDRKLELEVLEAFGRTCQALSQGRIEYDPAELAKRYRVRGMSAARTTSASAKGVQLNASDIATITTVDEARSSVGLPPIGGEDGALTLAQYQAKYAQTIASANAATQGEAAPTAPTAPAPDGGPDGTSQAA